LQTSIYTKCLCAPFLHGHFLWTTNWKQYSYLFYCSTWHLSNFQFVLKVRKLILYWSGFNTNCKTLTKWSTQLLVACCWEFWFNWEKVFNCMWTFTKNLRCLNLVEFGKFNKLKILYNLFSTEMIWITWQTI
jgi:hypothetical protein